MTCDEFQSPPLVVRISRETHAWPFTTLSLQLTRWRSQRLRCKLRFSPCAIWLNVAHSSTSSNCSRRLKYLCIRLRGIIASFAVLSLSSISTSCEGTSSISHTSSGPPPRPAHGSGISVAQTSLELFLPLSWRACEHRDRRGTACYTFCSAHARFEIDIGCRASRGDEYASRSGATRIAPGAPMTV